VHYTPAQDIERAMMAYDGLELAIAGTEEDRQPDIQRLVLGVGRVNGIYQAACYEEAGRMLPALIRGVETAARTCPSSDAIAIGRVRSQIYQATAMVLNRVGEADLAWTAADRAMTAAEHAEAGLMAALSAYRLAHVFTRKKRSTQARDLTTGAATALHRSSRNEDPERLSVNGSLHLADALAAAAEFDHAAADRSLVQAQQIADRLGEDRNDHWTAFGPSNVRIHRVSAAVAFGDADIAVETGETIDLQHLPPAWRVVGAKSVSISVARTPSNVTMQPLSTCSWRPSASRRSWSATTWRLTTCSRS